MVVVDDPHTLAAQPASSRRALPLTVTGLLLTLLLAAGSRWLACTGYETGSYVLTAVVITKSALSSRAHAR